jgi:hypothetical protein
MTCVLFFTLSYYSRLGITNNEIIAMQTRALIEAALAVQLETNQTPVSASLLHYC